MRRAQGRFLENVFVFQGSTTSFQCQLGAAGGTKTPLQGQLGGAGATKTALQGQLGAAGGDQNAVPEPSQSVIQLD